MRQVLAPVCLQLALGLWLLLTGRVVAIAQELSQLDVPVFSESFWLADRDGLFEFLTTQPPEYLYSVSQGGQVSFYALLGKLLFRSPYTIGGNAGYLGLSCNTCHVNGATNPSFYLEGLSNRPGGVDISHSFWNPRADDGRANPLDIPTLRGIRVTAPYGRDGRFASIREFTRQVITIEFGGDEPSELMLDALVAYQLDLAPLPNRHLDHNGNVLLTNRNLSDAENMFIRDCARCHVPGNHYLDGHSHNVGTGGYFDTPTLLGIEESAPYFHDGRASNLFEVVDHFDEVSDTNYKTDQQRLMVTYLRLLGSIDSERERINTYMKIDELQGFASLLFEPLKVEDTALIDLIVDMLRLELKKLHDRFPAREHAVARESIVLWADSLRSISREAELGAYSSAKTILIDWLRQGDLMRSLVEEYDDTSLFNPDVLGSGS